MIPKFGGALATIALAAMFIAASASAQQPLPWQLGFQPAATEGMSNLTSLYDMLLTIIVGICVLVSALLIWVMVRYNARANPTPSKTTNNISIEVAWTVIPVLVLMVIAVPSFRLLYAQDTIPEAALTIKIIGKQWYWTYEYPDHGNFTFNALMLSDERAAELGEPRLLGTTNRVVVPAGQTVRLLVTAADVIHSWSIPSFGVKIDAVPGRINQTWFAANSEGVYYGQCSELCGTRHAYMPITVEVVSQERFEEWVAEAQEKFAVAETASFIVPQPRVAAAAE